MLILLNSTFTTDFLIQKSFYKDLEHYQPRKRLAVGHKIFSSSANREYKNLRRPLNQKLCRLCRKILDEAQCR